MPCPAASSRAPGVDVPGEGLEPFGGCPQGRGAAETQRDGGQEHGHATRVGLVRAGASRLRGRLQSCCFELAVCKTSSLGSHDDMLSGGSVPRVCVGLVLGGACPSAGVGGQILTAPSRPGASLALSLWKRSSRRAGSSLRVSKGFPFRIVRVVSFLLLL